MMWCDSYSPITFSTAPTCYVCGFHGHCKKEAATGVHSTGSGKAVKESTDPKAAPNISENDGGRKHEDSYKL